MINCPGYRDSGVEWLKEVPQHWSVNKIKHIFRIKKDISGELGHSVLSITQQGVKIKDTESGKGQLSMDYSKYQLVGTNDFLMNHMDLLTGYVDISKYDGVTSPDYRVFQLVREKCDLKYFLYLFQNGYRSKIFYGYGRGSSHLGRWRLPTVEFKNFYLPVPPLNEQTLISTYLDKKTFQIDSLMKKVQRKIELLKEQRISLINQYVTKGLDPNVEMKDSGIKWIGDIPSHWRMTRLKYVLSIRPGNGIFKKRNQFGSGTKLVNVGDVFQDDFRVKSELLDRVICDLDELKRYSVRFGDQFFVRSSLKLEGIGVSSVFTGDSEEVIFECHLVRIRPDKNKVDPLYLNYLLNSFCIRNVLVSLSQTVTMTTISQDPIKSLVLPVPSCEEQKNIVTYLDKKTRLISSLIKEETKRIEILREYRQSLISNVVTGKVRIIEDMV